MTAPCNLHNLQIAYWFLLTKPGFLRWATEGREGDHASVLLTRRHLVYLTNGADLIMAQRGTAAFTVEQRYEVADSETWAIPILLGYDLLVRDTTGLMRLSPGQ